MKNISIDQVLDAHCKNTTSIKGIRILSFAVIASETNSFELFKNTYSLASYAVYDIVENQSGNHVERAKISKGQFRNKENSPYARTLCRTRLPSHNSRTYLKGYIIEQVKR
ncbi:transposase [Pedobacter lithocola]|uniref:Transposase n=1 Tax=Pedobacter lithocola TaxID=1908239 RepID=A0ABV8P427_9SPHI